MVGTLVMAPKSVTFRRHDHLVSVLFGDLLNHSYNITFSMFLDLVVSCVGRNGKRSQQKLHVQVHVWIAQDTTESRMPRLNLHSTQGVMAPLIPLCLERSTHLYV